VAGGRPVKKAIDALTLRERAAIVAGMKDVVERGLVALLSLSVFEKRTQKTPPREIEMAEHRLRDWRDRGAKIRSVASLRRR
jgi:hypothetical protein